jgi:hypothetical protein
VSFLLWALRLIVDHIPPNLDWTVVPTMAAAIFSCYGSIYTMHGLLRRRDMWESVLLLGPPFVLMGTEAIFLPLISSCYFADPDLLRRTGVEECLYVVRLYYEVLLVAVAFLIIAAFYVTYARSRVERYQDKSWFAVFLLTCGQEALLCAELLVISAASLLLDRAVLVEIPVFFTQLLFFGAVCLLYKTAVQLLTFVYVFLFGARGKERRDGDGMTLAGASLVQSGDDDIPSLFTFKKKIRGKCASMAIILAVFIAFCLACIVNALLHDYEPPDADDLPTYAMVALLFLALLFMDLRIALWAVFPNLYPAMRDLRRWGDPETTAYRFLREFDRPIFRLDGFILTEHFIIKESRVSMRVYSLHALKSMNKHSGSWRLVFDGKVTYRLPTAANEHPDCLAYIQSFAGDAGV